MNKREDRFQLWHCFKELRNESISKKDMVALGENMFKSSAKYI